MVDLPANSPFFLPSVADIPADGPVPLAPETPLVPATPSVSDTVTNRLASVADNKKAALGKVADERKRALGGDNPTSGAYDRVAMSGMQGNNLTKNSQYWLDVRTLTPGDLVAKYGDVALVDQGNVLGAEGRINNDQNMERRGTEVISDVSNSVAQGLGNAVGGIGALGAGIVSDSAGNAVAGALDDANEWAQSFQTPALNRSRKLQALQAELDSEDSEAQYQKDLENGDGFASLKKMGRDFVNAADRVISDPKQVIDVGAQGVGSLLAAGPIGKGVGAVGKLAKIGEELLEKGSTAVAIGSMEAGGNYVQAQQEVADMSDADLLANSPQYRELIANGMTAEEARLRVANNAGLTAGALTFPAAVAAGRLVAPFEKAPFKVNSVAGAANNIVKETVEEGVQGVTGQTAMNAGIQQNADETRDLTEGVGENLANSLIGGSLAAGTVQTPGVLLKTAADTVRAGSKAVINAGERVIEQNKAASPVAPEKIQQSVNTAMEQMPNVVGELLKVAEPVVKTEDQGKEVASFVNRVAATAKITPEEMQALPIPVLEMFNANESKTRFDAITAAAVTATREDVSTDDRITAGLFVLDQLAENEAVFNQDLPNALKSLKQDSPEFQMFDDYKFVLDSIRQHPVIQETLSAIAALPRMETIPAEKMSQQAVVNTVGAAIHKPSMVNADNADVILNMAEKGDFELSPAERAALVSSSSLVRATQEAVTELQQMQPKGKKTIDQVTEEIFNKSIDDRQLSLNDHLAGITRAYATGQNNAAREKLVDLMQFARHMGNKVNAFNQSFKKGGTAETYQSWNPITRKFVESKMPLTLRRNKEGSVNLAQTVYAQAKAVIMTANSVARAMPEFGVRELPVISLAPELRTAFQAVQEQAPVATESVAEEIQATTPETTEASQEASMSESEVVQNDRAEPVSEPRREESRSVAGPVDTGSTDQKPVERATVDRSDEKGDESIAQEESNAVNVPERSEDRNVTIKTQYPDLIQVNGKNFFHEAFKLPNEMISRLAGREAPFRDVVEALSNRSALIAFSGKAPKYKYEPALARAYDQYFNLAKPIFGKMQDRLKKVLEKRTGSEKKTLLEQAEAGVDVLRFLSNRALNIVDADGKYNMPLVQGAILAGLDFALNGDRTTYPLSKEDIARDFGIQEAEVTAEMEQYLNRGLSLTDAKRDLAQKIQSFWGVVPNTNAPEGYVKGIPETVAAEVLFGLQEAGLVKFDSTKINDREIVRVFFDERSNALDNLVDTLSAAPTAIADAVLIQNPDDPNIGTPPTEIATTQMRNPLVENTAQQKEAIRKAQNTPFYLNRSMVEFFGSMKKEDLLSFLGAVDLKDTKLNVNHQKSIEGFNRSLENSYNNLLRQFKQVQTVADGTNADVWTVPTYYKHNVSRVGRLHMLGSSNPQADKMAREFFMSTRANLDLTKDEDVAKFWMTIAQAVGLKTEKLSRADAVAQAQAQFAEGGRFAPFMSEFEEHVTTGKKMNPKIMNDLKTAMGSDLTMKALHAVLSVAKFNTAEDRTNFEHFLSLEADGKTDGPINALVHFSAGEFNARWLKNVAKGGLFMGDADKTLNAHQADDSADLYQETTFNLARILGEARNQLSLDLSEQSNALLKIMNALSNGDVKFTNDTDVELKRGVAKNPLTITIYGSGIDGIAGKVASSLVDEFYAQISNVLNGKGSIDPELVSNLERMVNYVPVQSEEEGLKLKQVGNFSMKGKSMKDFTFSAKEFNNIKTNVRRLFVDHLDASIKEVMGDSLETTKDVQRAIQIQSLVLKDIFNRLVQEKLAAKGAKKDEFLSQKEMTDIIKKLKTYSPLIQTGTQTFFVGAKARTDLAASTFGRALEAGDRFEKVDTPAFVYGPEDAGVGGIPYMVIGTGDGQMVQTILTDPKAPEGALYVFDGIELGADIIDEASTLINKGVFDSWMLNPVQNVADSYASMMRQDPLKVMTEEGIEALKKAIGGTLGDTMTEEDVALEMSTLVENLRNAALEIQARKRVMERVQLSVDHMASAESAYTNNGEVLPTDVNAKVARLNEMYQEELNILKGNKKKDVVEKATPEFTAALEQLGMVDQDTGVRIINAGEVDQVRLFAEIDNQHSEMLRKTAQNLIGSGYKILVGSPEQLAAYDLNNGVVNTEPMGFGQTNIGTKTIYIANPSAETLVHEMIHAATFDKVQAFYFDRQTLSKEDQDAIKRLDGLMMEWVEQTYDNEEPSAREARRMARNTIEPMLRAGKRSLALNEFMAWSLANKAISDVQKQTRVQNPLFRIAGKALAALKQLIWGGAGPKVSDSLYSNLRFNTRILLETPYSGSQKLKSVILHQSAAFGNDQRLTDLREGFYKRVGVLIDSVPAVDKPLTNAKVRTAFNEAGKLAIEFEKFFPMTKQESSTFHMIQGALATEAEFSPAALSRIADIHSDVMSKLKYTDLMRDPASTDPNEEYQAREQLKLLQGITFPSTDAQGRSALMSSFLALAMVNDDFRKVLTKLDLPKTEEDNSESTVDRVLNNLGMEAMDRLSIFMSGEGRKASNVREALDVLTEQLVKQAEDQQTFIEKFSNEQVNKFENYAANALQDYSKKLIDKTKAVEANTNNAVVRRAAQITRLMAGIINEEQGDAIASGVTSGLNRSGVWTPVRELMNEIIGRTSENAGVFDLVTKVRTVVQQTRQQFREELPVKLANHFSRKLSEAEWTNLFKGVGKTDVASLFDGNDLDTILKMLQDDSAVDQEIVRLESLLKSFSGLNVQNAIAGSKDLANFLNTGKVSGQFLRNAYAISYLSTSASARGKMGDDVVGVVDHLVTLYALKDLDSGVKSTLKELAANEKDGMEFLLVYLQGQRADEQSRIGSDLARMNHYKGYIPSENQLGKSLIVVADTEGAKLAELGFERVGDYVGSGAEGRGIKRGYYYANVPTRSTFSQGVMQTVRTTASGIDPETGQSVHVLTAGAITDSQEVARITAQLARNQKTTEPLMPVFDEVGKVIAYERAVDPSKLVLLSQNTHLGQMIGAWRGRQVEEAFAGEFNKQLVNNLYDIWEAEKTSKSEEFIDLSRLKKSDDPVFHDAWKLVGRETREHIESVFGDDGFMVRKDMLNNAIGYRNASVSDAWTGTTRWDPKVQEAFRKAAMGVFGNKAYEYLLKSEQFIQNAVSSAKVLIVVKSVVVPGANLLSNMYQLLMRGIPARTVLKGMAEKTVEVNQYIKNRSKQIELEADLRVAQTKKDIRAERRIQTELQALADNNKRMSIAKLIEAGEFTSISNGGVTQEDLALSNGKFVDYMEQIADRLPDGLKTMGRYALITKDTALFNGLARATQYGDFIAKAVLYDHLTKEKKMSPDEALPKISAEYVNYNLLPGRTRGYAESMGLLWFWNFKLRTLKVALSMIRENPVRSLFSALSPGVPVIGSLGNPLSDNILSVAADGRLGYSVGPEMGLRSIGMNPWVQLMD